MSELHNNFGLYNLTLVVSTGINGGGEGGGYIAVPFAFIDSEPTLSVVPDPTINTTIYYVSDSDGDDSNDGLSTENPKKTISAGQTLLNSTGGDVRLLLKRGDSFQDQNFDFLNTNSPSGEAPVVIGAYGTGNRPIVMPPSGEAGVEMIRPILYSNWAITDIDFYCYLRDPNNGSYVSGITNGSNGLLLLQGADNFKLYNCAFRYFTTALNIQDFDDVGFVNGIAISGCDILNSYLESGHANGIFLAGGNGLFDWIVLDDCIIDYNGWDGDVPDGKTIFEHNIYVQNSPSFASGLVVMRNCISTRASSHGVQLRPGGIVRDCFFAQNALGILIGGGDTPVPGGVSGVIHDNVIIMGTDIEEQPRGIGVDVENIKSAIINGSEYQTYCDISGNIVANVEDSGVNNLAIESGSNGASVFYQNNKEYAWSTIPPLEDEASNLIQGTFANPDINLATFDAAQGGPGTEANFYTNMRARATGYSLNDILSYFRSGYELS